MVLGKSLNIESKAEYFANGILVSNSVYWRVGIDRFGGTGAIHSGEIKPEANSYIVNPNQTVDFSPEEMFKLPYNEQNEDDDEWR